MAPNERTEELGCSKQILANAKSDLVFFVNGRKVVDSNPDPEMTLLTYLRTKLRLCGTKLGCGEGGCGACTVMISSVVNAGADTDDDVAVRHLSINACLTPVCSLHGMAVTTVEGIGSTKTRLHVVQERMASSHGSQCGFCTPGIVMSMYTLLRNKPKPNIDDIEVYFQGNLCRCTGYRPILEGYRSFTEDVWARVGEGKAEGCCGGAKDGVCCQATNAEKTANEKDHQDLYDVSKFRPYDPSQEPIFPPELRLNRKAFAFQSLVFRSDRMTWLRPTSLPDLLHLKSKFPEAKIVIGNTELGVEVKFKKCYYPVLIQPTKVAELTSITCSEDGVVIGAAVTLTDMETFLKDVIKTEPKWKTRVFVEIVEMLRWFAGKQIRNAAAVGGNVMTGSPISDLNPIFMAAGTVLEVAEVDPDKGTIKTTFVPFNETFFTGYRRNVIAPNQVLVTLKVPFTQRDIYFAALKQARRREDDIAIVNAAFWFKLSPDDKTILEARSSFGGMAPTTKMALKTSQFMIGKPWTNETVEQATEKLLEEFPLPAGVPGGMVRYRQALTVSFLLKAFIRISLESNLSEVSEVEKSAADIHHRKSFKSHQMWSINLDGKSDLDPVGRPIKHKSAELQATGEATYIDDIPRRSDELYLAFVLSSRAHANIVKVDASEALKESGVVDFICRKDVAPELNRFHTVINNDEILFAEDEVFCVGQIIGAVVAHNQTVAQRAAAKVVVEYSDLPAIVTIDDAIKNNSFYSLGTDDHIARGNPEQILSSSPASTVDHVAEGEVRIGGQEHFYLETNAALAIPWNENGEMEVFSSTQNPSEIQNLVATVLGVPMNRISVRVKRLGGGFGGKETRAGPISMAAAVAAAKLGRPVRVMLDRDEDMLMTGHRNPFYAKYKVGFNNDGLIKAVDVNFYNNAGYTSDLSLSVMHRALFQADNAYNIEHLRATGHCCKTNIQSNTAFRGFGGPQGMLVAETWIEDVADRLGMDPMVVRERNMYHEGQKTHFNMELENCTLRRCWEEVIARGNYFEQLKNIEKFNSENRWKKRGISCIPTKFGISFTAKHLNQAGALVQVYQDGSVLLSHGGTEMGQGLHTKMIQVASKALGVSHEKIHLTETATDKVPNTSPSAASVTSDLNGMAVYNACKKINDRLKPYKEKNPDGVWEGWIKQAYFDRVSLSATGFYATPDLNYSFVTNSGKPFSYFTYGAACSLVEIDCLTGDHDVIKTDIVMDVGESINPAIDIGQIEGGFMQGYGLFMMEQLVHSPDGVLFTRGPGAYKIPAFGDIPDEFNVSLLRGSSNPKAVYSSKGIGEPPLFLSSSVFFAVRNAIKAARKEVGLDKVHFQLYSPLSAERIRMACEDHITKMVPQLPPDGSYKPWGIQL